MKKRTFQIAAVDLLLAGIARTQTPPTPPPPPSPAQMVSNQVSRLTTLLTLTSAQQTEATTIFTSEETSLNGVRTNMHTAHTALRTAIEANDTSGISAAAGQIGSLTTQEVQAQGTAQAAFYAILTSDQQAKYKQLVGHGPGGAFHGFGPGGPPPAH